MRNRQVGPDVSVLAELVAKLSYKPGWTFELQELKRRWGSEGLTLCIGANVPNSLSPGESVGILHLMPVPPSAWDKESWTRWLLDQILLVERHESMEFFQIGEKRPYFPEHAEGCDFYMIAETKTQEDVERPSGPWFGTAPTDEFFAE